MRTIKIDDSTEQAVAMISYLKTLPFVHFFDIEEKDNDVTPTPQLITENLITEETVKGNLIEKDSPVPVTPIPSIEVIEKPHAEVIASSIEKQFLVDLKKGLSLNDRFRFQRDLFNGKPEEMNMNLDRLNEFHSFNEAWSFLEQKYKWNKENESVVAFRQLLEKRFS